MFLKVSLASAQSSLLVAAPTLPPEVYQEILAERKDLLSPAQAAILQYQQEEVRPEIFEIADQCLHDHQCQAIIGNFENLREQRLLNPRERQVLQELWQKTDRPLDCYWQNSIHCGLKKFSLEKLGLAKDRSLAIFIDGTIYKSNDNIFLLPRRKYQWRIISSFFQEKTGWATAEEAEAQFSLKVPYVLGGCLVSSPSEAIRKDLAEKIFVAFDPTCIRKLNEGTPSPTMKANESWIDKNKAWVISALVITIGAGYYLRDKQIEFSHPFK